ncbi:hypothetical protein TBLA_0A04280 [Henningerozyma blattae CBS 6284]|uniref:Zn(2)-C6 fungal-type domain-containing protein n=1 Tax=Henningerozyma blattae (strain ATCC 34711 / CBS 6284 / DSM 70876 / NBRC 10599 / NRRL Y-10934 / UCD 77-7) TaxID=1071380 RepID=I2GVS1_HENB6|nr:hypothetical protein TBLA_0A04280 [Tetrapisispora blattae CBS 6284]CCH58223.1 hypothetical protein TBLA_0A04280 [Tetrapisispora blattae CBS 6284]
MSRRGVKKPRPSKVCLTCRRRKVKCDQQHPSCMRCIKSSTLCTYTYSTPVSDDSLPDSLDTPKSMSQPKKSVMPTTDQLMTIGYTHTPSSITDHHDFNNNLPPSEVSPSELPNANLTNSNLPNSPLILSLWHPSDTMVAYGTITFIEPPFGLHTIVQSDHFSRAFAGAAHGTALFELQDSVILNSEGKLVPRLTNSTTTTTAATAKEVSLLVFLENAIKTSIQFQKLSTENVPPVNFIYSSYDINSNVNPLSLPILKTLLTEIEILLMDRETIDSLLKTFYQDIYPLFPILEINDFEDELKEIFDLSIPNRLQINIGDENVRKKLETLTLFLIIITISLKCYSIDPQRKTIQGKDALQYARQFSLLSHKLLYLLNVFKYTNELSLCCLLYFYIAEYLNPESLKNHANNETLLSIKCLYQMALTLGLYNEPTKYDRLISSNGITTSGLNFRRKLWFGLQMIIMQTSLSEGDMFGSEDIYLNLFMRDASSDKTPMDMFEDNNAPGFDSTLSQILLDQYKFHISMVHLIQSLQYFTGNANLSTVLENVEILKSILDKKFPLSKLKSNSPTGFLNNNESSWRGATLNAYHLQNATLLRINILGYSTLLNIYQTLLFHFEELCKKDAIKYSPYYHDFTSKAISSYCQLFTIVSEYQQEKYKSHIPTNFKFAINRLICFTIVKLWIFQSSCLLRIAFKKLQLNITSNDSNNRVGNNNPPTLQDNTINNILNSINDTFTSNMRVLNGFANDLGQSYISISVACSMFKYIHYLAKNNALTTYTNRFWSNGFEGKSIPVSVQRKIAMKWGLNIKNSHKVMHNLNNPETLASYNQPILNEILTILSNYNPIVFNKRDELEPQLEYNLSQGVTEDLMNQFLENNLEWVTDVINESLGELPNFY